MAVGVEIPMGRIEGINSDIHNVFRRNNDGVAILIVKQYEPRCHRLTLLQERFSPFILSPLRLAATAAL